MEDEILAVDELGVGVEIESGEPKTELSKSREDELKGLKVSIGNSSRSSFSLSSLFIRFLKFEKLIFRNVEALS